MRKLLLVVMLVCVAVALIAQTGDKPKVQIVPAKHTSAASGQEMYKTYCASCHGVDGKGSGPASSAMKEPVPDITRMQRQNNGKYPEARVIESIRGDRTIAAHGSKDMPVWGAILSQVSRRDEAELQLRYRNLADHIASLQEK
ncbi:MAG TPA: cytochrome c [Terriglobales bacterium]|nr:cytochrome c [Terriglobales bacterium]